MDLSKEPIIIRRALTRAGLVTWAKTFRLVLDSEALWVIHLGGAMGPKFVSNDIIADKIAGVVLKGVEAKMMKQLVSAEASLEGMPLAELVKRKHSFRVPISERGAVTMSPDPRVPPRLIVKSAAGKAKLDGSAQDRELYESIAAAFA